MGRWKDRSTAAGAVAAANVTRARDRAAKMPLTDLVLTAESVSMNLAHNIRVFMSTSNKDALMESLIQTESLQGILHELIERD